MRTRIEDLLDELCAINFWDRDYLLRDELDRIERIAREARQARLKEICDELAVLLCLIEKCGTTVTTFLQ